MLLAAMRNCEIFIS